MGDRAQGSRPGGVKGRWGDVSAVRSRIMRANRRRDTGPELAVRSALHAAGLRFRVDFRIPVASGRPIRPDVVFTKRRVALFIDGCFWHGCPVHGTSPSTNSSYWNAKIAENRQRDRRHSDVLAWEGWRVVRVWEHEAPKDVVEAVMNAFAGEGHGSR